METKSQMINRIAELAKENAELKGTIDAYQMSENEANEIIAELKAENDGSKSSCKDFVLPTKQFYQQILANVITKITKVEEE